MDIDANHSASSRLGEESEENHVKKLRKNLDESELLAEQETFLNRLKTDPKFQANVDKIYYSPEAEERRKQRNHQPKADQTDQLAAGKTGSKQQQQQSNIGSLQPEISVFMPLQIIERNVQYSANQSQLPLLDARTLVPSQLDAGLLADSIAERLDNQVTSITDTTTNRKRMSLFARQQLIEQQKKRTQQQPEAKLNTTTQTKDSTILAFSSEANHPMEIDNDDDEKDITYGQIVRDAENLTLCPPQKVKKYMNALGLDKLDPSLIAFLRNRKSAANVTSDNDHNQDVLYSTASVTSSSPLSISNPDSIFDKKSSYVMNSILKDEHRQEGQASSEQISIDDQIINDQVACRKKPIASTKKVSFDTNTIKENETNMDDGRDLSFLPISKDDVRRNKWLNMDVVEKEKLEWLKPIENELRAKSTKSESFTARFKFDGDLAFEDEDSQLNVKDGLHHHGEEQHRAGYTVNELITLCQSQFPAQKITGLQTLGNIFERMHRGYFDIAFDKPFASSLFESSDILIIVRKCLDDSHESVMCAAIKCLRDLICNTLYDEAGLDRIFCSFELGVEIPKLNESTDKNELVNNDELKDDQLCRMDVIQGLLRIDTLLRLRYLLDLVIKQRQDRVIIDHILDILIRICRHSLFACQQLLTTPYLLDSIIENFIPSPEHSQLNWKALKVVRILFTSSADLTRKILATYPRLTYIFRTYLLLNPFTDQSSGPSSQQSKQVYATTIEILRLWRVLLITNCFPDTCEKFLELSFQLQNCINIKLLVENSFDHHYVCNLLLCLIPVIKQEPAVGKTFTPLVKQLVFTWIQEITSYNLLPNIDGCLALASGIHYLNSSSLPPATLSQHILRPFMTSTLMKKFTSQLLKQSAIVHYKEHRCAFHRNSSALPSFGCILFGGQSIQTNRCLSSKSVLSLLVPLINIAIRSNNTKDIAEMLLNEGISKYFQHVCNSPNTLQWSIFELVEFNVISQAALASTYLAQSSSIYLELSLKIISSVSELDIRKSLFDFIFDYRHYANVVPSVDKQQLVDIKRTFEQLAQFNSHHWIFEPIICLLKAQSVHNTSAPSESGTQLDVARHVTNCLLMTNLLRNTQPDFLSKNIDQSLLFVFITSVFCLNDGIFLEPGVHQQLEQLFSYFSTIDFQIHDAEEKMPEPFSSLISHFDALCTSFQAESYGDVLFTNYLLLLMQQANDHALRARAINHHAPALKYFLLTREQLLFSEEKLLHPTEKQLHIVEGYLRCILSGDISPSRNSFYYGLLLHHIGHFLYSEDTKDERASNQQLVSRVLKSIELTKLSSVKEDIKRFI